MAEADILMADVPDQDPHFVLRVMARIEQRRFRREMARTGMLTAATIALLALVMPKVDVTMLANLPQEYDVALAAVLMAVMISLPRLSRVL